MATLYTNYDNFSTDANTQLSTSFRPYGTYTETDPGRFNGRDTSRIHTIAAPSSHFAPSRFTGRSTDRFRSQPQITVSSAYPSTRSTLRPSSRFPTTNKSSNNPTTSAPPSTTNASFSKYTSRDIHSLISRMTRSELHAIHKLNKERTAIGDLDTMTETQITEFRNRFTSSEMVAMKSALGKMSSFFGEPTRGTSAGSSAGGNRSYDPRSADTGQSTITTKGRVADTSDAVRDTSNLGRTTASQSRSRLRGCLKGTRPKPKSKRITFRPRHKSQSYFQSKPPNSVAYVDMDSDWEYET